MATKKPKLINAGKLIFKSAEKNLLVQRGQLEDEKSRKFLRKALGIDKGKVEATRHTILSGPPGVGKTYGAMDECHKAGIEFITIAPGMTDLTLAIKLAVGVAKLGKDEELVVILDDADDVVFGDYKTLNKWKLAMGDVDHNLGIIPYYHYPASMLTTLSQLEKQGKQYIAETIKSWQSDSDIGVSIPMDRVRFVVLCNIDLEDPKAFGKSTKLKSAIDPVLDRFKYKRMDIDIDGQWGWLAYTLGTSQPFEEHPLDTEQKKELLDWMKSSWPKLRSTSYRTVRKLAADMINNPDSYEDEWQDELKGH